MPRAWEISAWEEVKATIKGEKAEIDAAGMEIKGLKSCTPEERKNNKNEGKDDYMILKGDQLSYDKD